MSKTAILVDGGFFRKRSNAFWDNHSAKETADALITYCMRHLKEHNRVHELYRIFYYDCPPVSKQVFHPLKQNTVYLGATEEYKWMVDFLSHLKQKRKVALRLGKLDDNNTFFTLRYDAVKKICSKAMTVPELTMSDFEISIRQKGVDMKIGIDIASLAFKRQVEQIVLIAGDSDFVPAAKLARREGVDVVLDPLGQPVKDDLFEHIDGLRSCGSIFQASVPVLTSVK